MSQNTSKGNLILHPSDRKTTFTEGNITVNIAARDPHPRPLVASQKRELLRHSFLGMNDSKIIFEGTERVRGKLDMSKGGNGRRGERGDERIHSEIGKGTLRTGVVGVDYYHVKTHHICQTVNH